jgi:hypothetical protein
MFDLATFWRGAFRVDYAFARYHQVDIAGFESCADRRRLPQRGKELNSVQLQIITTLPMESRCMNWPSNISVTVARLMWGWGRTSTPSPTAKWAGPAWSKNIHGPTLHCNLDGKVRLTLKLPRSFTPDFSTKSMPSLGFLYLHTLRYC